MGPAGLTAVFGMGTGVAPPVSSPGNRTAGDQAAPAASPLDAGRMVTQAVVVGASQSLQRTRVGVDTRGGPASWAPARPGLLPGGGSGGVGVVKPLGC